MPPDSRVSTVGRFVIPFTDPAAADVARAGGKGANLAALTQAGFPVPGGAVVSPDAYRAFMAPVTRFFAGLRGVASTDHIAIRTASDALHAAAASLAVPVGLEAEVADLVAAAPGAHWAVRSSGTAEDTAGAAFAGQHDTYLNCVGSADVLDHIRQCWLSLWSPRAIAYRAQMGFDQTDVTMAVVIQRMIFSDVAGVGFSVNPVNGNLTEAVLNANFGLGESVVSGEGEIDHLVVEKATGRVIEARIANKTTRVVAARRGTEEVTVGAVEANRAALTPEQIATLAALLVRIESHYGWPQDIEWGIVGDDLFLLQSRPITTIPPCWTRDESAERFPNPVTPFTWDFVEAGFHRSLNHSFRLMGLPEYDGKWFAEFGAYVYGNQNAVELYARRAPVRVTSLAELAPKLPEILERFRWVRTLPAEWHTALPAYLRAIDGFAQEPLSSYDLRGLWDYIERVNAVGSAYFLPNIAISIGHGLLHRSLTAVLAMGAATDGRVDGDVDRLTAALVACETMTTRVNAALRALAVLASEDDAFTSVLRRADARELTAARSGPSRFWTAFDAFLREHGHRETDFDAYHPTWAEAPWVVLDHVRALLDVPPGQAASSRTAQADLQEQVVGQTPHPLRDLVRTIIVLAREYTALDDLEHYHTTRLAQPLRRGVHEIGARLVAKGVLSDPLDAFFASNASLRHAIATDAPVDWAALAGEVRDHKATYQNALATAPAWRLGETTPNAVIEDGTMTGIPGSPGIAEGVVHIIRGVDDFPGFPKGGVLVARTTNPAWTPLFYTAAAVVTESGGPLSHGAVTAREMKIPAVMAVRGVLTALANGDRVRVDGSAGRVVRL